MERIDMQVVVECMQDAFNLGKTFIFTPYGDSMLPTLKNGKDSVTLAPAKDLVFGDIILYRRPNGNYTMHRLVGKAKKGYMLCGDNENAIEYPIPPENVLAKVIAAADENGKPIDLRAKKNVRRLWYKRLKLHIYLWLNKK